MPVVKAKKGPKQRPYAGDFEAKKIRSDIKNEEAAFDVKKEARWDTVTILYKNLWWTLTGLRQVGRCGGVLPYRWVESVFFFSASRSEMETVVGVIDPRG